MESIAERAHDSLAEDISGSNMAVTARKYVSVIDSLCNSNSSNPQSWQPSLALKPTQERTVAALLAVGAKANVVTDPTPEFPSGHTPTNLSSRQYAAAMRIQHKFRGWKIRREFLNLRQQVIKIQACFRGHQSRKQYRKILWSVGILEKAILRWRQKRKGLRGHKVVLEISSETRHGREIEHEEDFFRIGRKYAEERVERSVVRVQAMYRSYRARADYRRMKQFHKQVQLEYEHVHDLDPNTDSANDISVE